MFSCAAPANPTATATIHLSHHAAGDPTSVASLSEFNLDPIDALVRPPPPSPPDPEPEPGSQLATTPSPTQGHPTSGTTDQGLHLPLHQQQLGQIQPRRASSPSRFAGSDQSHDSALRHHPPSHPPDESNPHDVADDDHHQDQENLRPRHPSLHRDNSRDWFSRSDTDSSYSNPESSTVRSSRRDKYLHSTLSSYSSFWPSGFDSLQRLVVGAIRCPALPPFSFAMSFRSKNIPETPRVISPSPTPSEKDVEYSGPVTRSAARRRTPTPQPLEERSDEDESDSPDLRRARTRSRSPIDARAVPRMTRRTSTAAAGKTTTKAIVTEDKPVANGNGKAPGANGHLAPPQPTTPLGWSWRDFSRSPSPLGLIPIHRHWRTFVHKHEVPRKVLHVSIGFFVIWLYVNGTQPRAVTPWLMSALIPIAATDWLRHRYAPFNRFYVKVLGALMRESEYSGWNGVIWYLLGAWIVLYGFPKDVGIMSVLLLSWCDTAASTFGRLWGRYTPRLRRGKSLAGSTAAFLVGVGTSYFFYNWLVPTFGPYPGDEGFLFTGALSLPKAITDAVGLSKEQATITGSLALGVMGLWSGFVASASEVVDIFGWDDNLTIPVLSGIGIWGFLKVFS